MITGGCLPGMDWIAGRRRQRLGQFDWKAIAAAGLKPLEEKGRKLEGAIKLIIVLSGTAAATGLIMLLRGRPRSNPSRRRYRPLAGYPRSRARRAGRRRRR